MRGAGAYAVAVSISSQFGAAMMKESEEAATTGATETIPGANGS